MTTHDPDAAQQPSAADSSSSNSVLSPRDIERLVRIGLSQSTFHVEYVYNDGEVKLRDPRADDDMRFLLDIIDRLVGIIDGEPSAKVKCLDIYAGGNIAAALRPLSDGDSGETGGVS